MPKITWQTFTDTKANIYFLKKTPWKFPTGYIEMNMDSHIQFDNVQYKNVL